MTLQQMRIGTAVVLVTALCIVACDDAPRGRSVPVQMTPELVFTDARTQAKEFIGYYHSISLTAEQQQTKTEALEAIPAPCCDQSSIATCCCPCNLAKATWGLAHFLIARSGYDAARTRAVAERWLRFTNESGYAGDACYQGRCSLPFHDDGCGGMDEGRVL